MGEPTPGDEEEMPGVAGSSAARARAVIPGGVNSAQRQFPGVEDLVIVSSSGSTLTDAAGRTYTDTTRHSVLRYWATTTRM